MDKSNHLVHNINKIPSHH